MTEHDARTGPRSSDLNSVQVIVIVLGGMFGSFSVLTAAYVAVVIYLGAMLPGTPPQVQGCPSRAFPVYPGSYATDNAQITVDGTTGCWTVYRPPNGTTASDVYRFYTDAANTPGWRLDETYANTGYAAYTKIESPALHALIEIGDSSKRPPGRGFDLSVCACDPRTMSQ